MNWLKILFVAFMTDLGSTRLISVGPETTFDHSLLFRRAASLRPEYPTLEKRTSRIKTTKTGANPTKKSASPASNSPKARPNSGKVSKTQAKSVSKPAKTDPQCNGRLNKRGQCFSSPSRPQPPARSNSPRLEPHIPVPRLPSQDSDVIASSRGPRQSLNQPAVASSSRPLTGQGRLSQKSSGSSTDSGKSASSVRPQINRPGRSGSKAPHPAVNAKIRGPGVLSIDNGRTFRGNTDVSKGDILEHYISGTSRAHALASQTPGNGNIKLEAAGPNVKAKLTKHTLGTARVKISDINGVRKSYIDHRTPRNQPQRFTAWSRDPMRPASIKIKTTGNISSEVTAQNSPPGTSTESSFTDSERSASTGNAFGRDRDAHRGLSDSDSPGKAVYSDRPYFGRPP